MKIFADKESTWESKINFVDVNNVFVGYDTGQGCCEDAGWFIAESITPYQYELECKFSVPDVDSYVFDKDFFERVHSPDLDSGGMAVFKLVSERKPDLFLHLYNAHNGYYGHGFTVKHDGEIVRDDCL